MTTGDTATRRYGRMVPALALLLAGCAATDPKPPDNAADHPLTDRIWDVRQGRFVDYAALLEAAAGTRHLLLGETHINPAHQRIQLQIIRDLMDDGSSLAVAFEIFEHDRQAAIDRALSEPRATTDDVAAATGIEDSGWDWDSYEPLVRLAQEHRLPVLAANATRGEVRRVADEGLTGVPPDRQAALGLTTPLPASAQEALAGVIVDSHCGHVFGDMTERLIDAQRLRDATMADVMLQARPDTTVLVTGAGHARRDYGVPVYLLERAPGARVLSIGLMEVASSLSAPADYLNPTPGLDVAFDYLWFTNRVVSEDPCEQFREQLERIRRHTTAEGAPAGARPASESVVD